MSVICLKAGARKWFYAKEKNISVIKMHKSLAFEIAGTERIQVTQKKVLNVKLLLRMRSFIKQGQGPEQTLFSKISASLTRK